MYVLVALFCMMGSPMVSDCHIVVTKELAINRDNCMADLRTLIMLEAGQGYMLSSAQCHPIERSDI
jgi:hypothetical protein